MAQKVREKNPETKIVIAADDDALTDGNPGLTQAKEAARVTGSFIACPKFGIEADGGKFSDFNDMHALYGLIAVRSRLQEAVLLESDKELPSKEQEERKKKKTHGEELLELAENLYLYKNLNDTIFADIAVKTHIETWPIRHKTFKQWLAGQFYEKFHKAPGSQTLSDVILTLESKALYEGHIHEVFTRLGKHENSIYFDLCNSS